VGHPWPGRRGCAAGGRRRRGRADLHAPGACRAGRGQPDSAGRERGHRVPGLHRAGYGVRARARGGRGVDRGRPEERGGAVPLPQRRGPQLPAGHLAVALGYRLQRPLQCRSREVPSAVRARRRAGQGRASESESQGLTRQVVAVRREATRDAPSDRRVRRGGGHRSRQ
jgi:hypothetical protein